MAATQITITFSNGGVPSVTLPIPAGVDARQFTRNIVLAGGCWFVDANGLQNWVPISQVTKITAQ